MTHIERLWLKEYSFKVLENITLLYILQFFFQWIRDIKNTDSLYTLSDCFFLNAIDAFTNLVEIIPLILFVSAFLVHERWSSQGYFLRSLLDGMTQRQWVSFACVCCLTSLGVALCTQSLLKPLCRGVKIDKMEKKNLVSKEKSEKLFFLSPEILMHYNQNPSEIQLVNLVSFEPLVTAEYQNQIQIWKEYTQDSATGLDTLSLEKKIYYFLNHHSPEDQKHILGSFFKDLFFICSFFSAWMFIELDRRSLPLSSKKSSSQRTLVLRFFQGLFLYWSLKVLPLLSIAIPPSSILIFYGISWIVILFYTRIMIK